MKRARAVFCLMLTVILPVLYANVSTCAADAFQVATAQLPGLRGSVIIRRDERGIPYIEAANDEDLYFAQGYITASDRLWQMDLLRRTGRGELAEIFGRGALEEDKRARAYGFAQVAEAELVKASSSYRAALESYARGVNAFINSCDEKSLPLEFRLLKYKPRIWQPTDSMVVGKTFSLALSTTWQTDLMREAMMDLPQSKREALLTETSPLDVILVGSDRADKKARSDSSALHRRKFVDQDFIALSSIERATQQSLDRVGLYAESLAASNNWVVSGKRTASGKPLLANDPHLAASAPSIWYMTHLSAPGGRMAGVSIPGLPSIIIGHNEQIAWGLTNLGADAQDLYIESFDEHNPRLYKTPAGWSESLLRTETIKVRKVLNDAATEDVIYQVTVTRHGPIIFESGSRRYALQWTALNPKVAQLEAFFRINRARNWEEFCAALKNYREPSLNFVYADVSGHIGYYAAGEIPIRKTGDGSLPYDGSSDQGEWINAIPFGKLPHLFDPPSGIIVTANNRVVGADYPYFITRDWAQPYRARRIYDLLKAKQKLTIDDFRTVQGDTYSYPGTIFARELVKTASGPARASGDAKWIEALRKVEEWDGCVNANSRGALLVLEMRYAFSRRIFASALGVKLSQQYLWLNSDTLLDRIIMEKPAEWLPEGFADFVQLFHACYMDARESLTKSIGADESKWEWEYAPYTQARFPHPLANAPLIGQQFKIDPFPISGSYGTINLGTKVSMRFIADVSGWDNTQMGIPLGQSGDPMDAHWKDQLGDWRAITPRPFPFNKSAVAQATKQTLILAP
jgi:penicillin G amidase